MHAIMTKNEGWKSCPFCKCEKIEVKERKTVIAECKECGALIIRMTIDEAKEAWNNRAQVFELVDIQQFMGESIDFWCELKRIADDTKVTEHIKEILKIRSDISIREDCIKESLKK